MGICTLTLNSETLGCVWRRGQMGHLVAQMAIYTKWPFEKKLRVWPANFANDKMAIWAADRPFGQSPISPIHRLTICKWLDRFSLSSLPILYHHPYSSCYYF